MAIVIMKASKATPTKAMNYITDKGKASVMACQHIDPSQDPARQMMETAKLWGKAQEEGDRKYYHLKVSFHPDDWVKNGGILTEQEALRIGMQLMWEFCPGYEGVGSVHVDKGHLHFHGLVNAVELETGKLLDMRRADYRRLKDRAQELCAERGLNAMDWRKATAEKRAKEIQGDLPVNQTFAEKGLQTRGKAVWKDELRSIIDQAAASCSSMDEFRAQLEKEGVVLTRCTEETISYKLGDHKACRGDTLGGDYTAAAIYDAIDHNQQYGNKQKEDGRKAPLGAQISSASAVAANKSRPAGADRRRQARELGRLAGMTRMEIDSMCDYAPRASWEEKQAAWDDYKVAKAEFWDTYNEEIQRVQGELDEAYERRKKLQKYEWVLDPRNQRYSFLGGIIALIYILTHDSSFVTDMEIARLREQQQRLREEAAVFRSGSKKALETLRKKGLVLDEYMDAVKAMQEKVEELDRSTPERMPAKRREELSR